MTENVIPYVISKTYPTFQSFYENEKSQIYLKIIETFEQLLQSDNNIKLLVIVAKVENTTFDTGFEINKNNIKLLTETISPYFEKFEEYEVCDRIHDLCLKLKKN
jgi:hypothetical protein